MTSLPLKPIRLGIPLLDNSYLSREPNKTTIHTLLDHIRRTFGSVVEIVPLIVDQTESVPFDALLLPGGHDVEEDHRETSSGSDRSRERVHDRFETHLTQESFRKSLPIFGICRGMQVLNVALGGTLQDLRGDKRAHHKRAKVDVEAAKRREFAHDISVESDSQLARIWRDKMKVNSLHSSCLQRVSDPLRVTAWADDGVIEAVEHREHPFIQAVQFHPEDLLHQDDKWEQLFENFFQLARERCHSQ